MTAPETSAKNRRISLRLPVKASTKATCVKGSLGLGTNLALGILDVSETGVRLVAKAAMEKGQEIEVTLLGPARGRPVKLLAHVIRCGPGHADGTYIVGARFQKRLAFRDLQDLVVREA